MADISVLKLPNNTSYNLKDASASQQIDNLKNDIGIVEENNTAVHTISEGQYVMWKGLLYKASAAIPAGTTLSSTNLTAISNGGFNNLQSGSGSGSGSGSVIKMHTETLTTDGGSQVYIAGISPSNTILICVYPDRTFNSNACYALPSITNTGVYYLAKIFTSTMGSCASQNIKLNMIYIDK